MAALPIVEFDRGFQNIRRGSLFDCPVEFFSKAQMSFYQASREGWNKCPLGYWSFSAYDSMGRKLVVPGILVPGDTGKKRSFPNYSLKFSRTQIEEFLKPHLSVAEEVRIQRDGELQNLTHDLRAIGAEIYNTALSARNQADFLGMADVTKAVDNIVAAQQMLSIRLDIVDYESGHAAGRPKQLVPIFRKIDKVLRCFQLRFAQKSVRYRIEGTSFSNVMGPPIFEIIPFVLIENAIKYAPPQSDVTVRFEENVDELIIRIESFGPKISDQEKEKIFEKHYRGEAAKSSESSGSEIGLYAAKTLVESQYGGKIFVNQLDDCIMHEKIGFYKTRFTLLFPIDDSERILPRRSLKNKSVKSFFFKK